MQSIRQRIIDSKPSELEHLYIDGDDQLRDRHIESMFSTLFFGEDIDTQFSENFTLYCTMLLGDEHSPPPEVYTEAAVATGWVCTYFGLLHITDNVIGLTAGDPDLAHCTHRARLRTRYAVGGIDDAFAPSAHHAALLAVVIVLRHLAENWHESQFGKNI